MNWISPEPCINCGAVCCRTSPEDLPYTEHSKLERNRMREIMDYLEHNYMNKIQMKDIAEEIHLCESECSRLFKRYMNVSLFTFLQEYRVERSLEFLLSSGDSIMEVALKSGFTDSNYYAKVFSRIKGCSPQKYRKQNVTVHSVNSNSKTSI